MLYSTSLIKYRQVPVFDNPDKIIRYFVELEAIEGDERRLGNFVYYYGFVDLKKEKQGYHIANLEFHGEVYLCAPMHGWAMMLNYLCRSGIVDGVISLILSMHSFTIWTVYAQFFKYIFENIFFIKCCKKL